MKFKIGDIVSYNCTANCIRSADIGDLLEIIECDCEDKTYIVKRLSDGKIFKLLERWMKKPTKQIFSQDDPYGEEDWNEIDEYLINEEMTRDKVKIGMRVFVKCFYNRKGTVVFINNDGYIGLDMDEETPWSHDCDGKTRHNHGFWLADASQLALIEEEEKTVGVKWYNKGKLVKEAKIVETEKFLSGDGINRMLNVYTSATLIDYLNDNFLGWVKIDHQYLSSVYSLRRWRRIHIKGQLIFSFDAVYDNDTIRKFDIPVDRHMDISKIIGITKCEMEVNRLFSENDPYGEEDWDINENSKYENEWMSVNKDYVFKVGQRVKMSPASDYQPQAKGNKEGVVTEVNRWGSMYVITVDWDEGLKAEHYTFVDLLVKNEEEKTVGVKWYSKGKLVKESADNEENCGWGKLENVNYQIKSFRDFYNQS